MKRIAQVLLVVAMAAPSLCDAASKFDGTWRPDPQRMDPNAPPDVIRLVHGVYECRSCTPPYTIRADGRDQPIEGNPRFDSMNILVVDDFTVQRVGKRKGSTVVKVRTVVSHDGASKIDTQSVTDMGPPFEFAVQSKRLAPGEPHSHAVSGTWRAVEADLAHHEEDTSYRIQNGVLSMKDRLGRSFAARLDGMDAAYHGDTRYATVSVKLVDDHTIEEHDKKGGKVVFSARWTVDPDGRTMHVRFEDAQGHVMKQSGHRIG